MILLQCEEKDYSRVAELYDRVVKHLQETVNLPKWSAEHPSHAGIAEAIKNGEQYAYEEDGRLLGAAILSENPEGAYETVGWSRSLKEGEYLVVHVLAVDPAYERKGIGQALVDGSIEVAKARGYKALRLDVLLENLPAIRLYEKNGFTFAGISGLGRNIEGIKEFGLYERNL